MKLGHVLCLILPALLSSVGHKQRLLQQRKASEDTAAHALELLEGDDRRGGGHKQRRTHLEDTAATSSSSAADLPFNRDLVKDWATGHLTSKQVQRYALHAMQQGADGLDNFARMGNFGENPQNVFRAMRTVLGLPKGAPEMDWYEIPTTKSNRTPHPFLLPHRFLLRFTSVEAVLIGQSTLQVEQMHAISSGIPSKTPLSHPCILTWQKTHGNARCPSACTPTLELSASKTQYMSSVLTLWLGEVHHTRSDSSSQ